MWNFFRKRKQMDAANNSEEVNPKNYLLSEKHPYEQVEKSTDFVKAEYKNRFSATCFQIAFFNTLIDDNLLQSEVLPALLNNSFTNLEDLKEILPVYSFTIISRKTLVNYLLEGNLAINIEGDESKFAVVNITKVLKRDISPPENESGVFGPKEAFIESLDDNLNLIRKRLQTEKLVVETVEVGTLSKTNVAILYIHKVAENSIVNKVRERLYKININTVLDSNLLAKLVEDETNSIFPQSLSTERPDRVCHVLSEGKVVLLTNGSPSALITPITLINFLISFEDYYSNWIVASFLRNVRLFSVIFSVTISSFYVAIVTYHYQLIPRDLLTILVSSRREIPFPPIMEALILEIMIEVLREAGARLPTKIGQTIGIVGGIVIGTASVEAGLTSNVLLLLVAMSALASFTTPIYEMGNAIRLLRFPFLIFAHLWGLIGISICTVILLVHLLNLTSMGQPYLRPFYPINKAGLTDTVVRLPFKVKSILNKKDRLDWKLIKQYYSNRTSKDIDK